MTQPQPLPPNNPVLAYAASSSGVREIASRQRILLLCILGYLAAVALQFAPPELRIIALLMGVGFNITASVFVFLLAIKIYGTGLGVTLGILTLIPCVGLIVLLIVNSKATGLLRAAGLRVGLLGATIPPDFPQ